MNTQPARIGQNANLARIGRNAIAAGLLAVAALAASGAAHADSNDSGYDMDAVCRAERNYGREVAIASTQFYYGVSEMTAERIVSDCSR